MSPQLIFCSGNSTATATGKPSGTSSGAGESGSGNPSGGASPGATTNAAVVLGVPTQGVSKAGMGMAAMVVVSAIFGALL